MKIKIKIKIKKIWIADLAPSDWSPYTPPDLCGFPSGNGAWVLAHPRNDPRPSDPVAPRWMGIGPLTPP